MFTSDQIISEIKSEKSKKTSPLLNLNTVLNVSSSILGCQENKRNLINNVHKQSSDEDLISIYFAIPIVISSLPESIQQMQGVWDVIREEIEVIIPELKSFHNSVTKRKTGEILSMNPSSLPFINDDDLLSLDIDAALTFMSIQLRFMENDKSNAEHFWAVRAALAPNRRLTKKLDALDNN